MAEIIGFTNVKGLYDELVKDIDLNREHPEKFVSSLQFAYPGNKGLLDTFNIRMKRPSQWIVLTIEPTLLEKALLRARDFGFLEAYQQNPSFIKQDVDLIIKRMSELDSLGIPYQNDAGKYQGYLFSSRGFNYVKDSFAREDEGMRRGRAA